jgi:hypothetical protein
MCRKWPFDPSVSLKALKSWAFFLARACVRRAVARHERTDSAMANSMRVALKFVRSLVPNRKV